MTYCDMMVILYYVEPYACRHIYPANGHLLAKDPATAPECVQIDDGHEYEENES